MFAGRDTLKKRSIVHEEGDEFFYDDGVKYLFSDITSYYHQETLCYTNSVYQGTSLLFTVTFKKVAKPYSIEIDSNKEAKYKTVYLLSFAIATYRAKMLRKAFEEGYEVRFATLDVFSIVIKDGNIFLKYHDKPNVRIEKITQSYDEKYLEFTTQDRDERIRVGSISDKLLFLELCSQVVLFEKEPLGVLQTTWQNITSFGMKLYFVYIVVFGFYYIIQPFCCEDMPQNGWSETGAILLVFTTIMYVLMRFFVLPQEIKKRKKEMDNLVG